MKKLTFLLLPLLLLATLLAACGGDDDDDAKGSNGDDATDEAAGDPDDDEAAAPGDELPADAPRRIVSLSPSATETLYAIGAGDQVVAVDLNSNYPDEAPDGTLDAYNPNVEAIAELEPDLVVASDDSLAEGLGKLQIPLLIQAAPTKLSEVYMQVKTLGVETGHADAASDLANEMRAKVVELKQQAPKNKVSYYYELDQTYFSVTSTSFIGTVLKLAGLTNIADAAGQDNPYPQLSSEFIVQANPRLIFLADTKCCQQDAAAVAARPGWAELTAVKAGGIVELDDDVASRWGPRIVDLLQQAVEAANAAAQADAKAA